MNNIIVKINDENYCYKKGTSLLRISKDFKEEYRSEIVAGIVNNELTDLTKILDKDCNVDFLDISSKDGWMIYRRSLLFLFLVAFKKVMPNNNISVHHALNKGLYCEIIENITIKQEQIKEIREMMKEIVLKDISFVKHEISKQEAIDIFNEHGYTDKANLLNQLDRKTINIYDCDGVIDYFYGDLVPSTGFLNKFEIFKVKDKDNAIMIISPKRENPNELVKYNPSPKLIKVYDERKNWSKIMGVHLLSNLNDIILKNEYPELIRTMEALHENKIATIANKISNGLLHGLNKGRIILLAGPSSSGKTSTCKRLALQLKVNGLNPITLSTDDYFVDRGQTPLDENGKPDYESIYTVDLDLFNKQLMAFLEGKEVEIPTFNFITGTKEFNGKKLKIKSEQPIIIEGIHALNPILTKSVPDEYKFKLYVSPLTQLNVDEHNRIPTTDTRLIRRIVRDNKYRGHDARKTISMWESVRDGEKKYIYPYQEEADEMFNSSLTYELSVLKKYIVPLLEDIHPHEAEYLEAKRLLKFLEYFKEIKDELDIPPTSILREFIGNSRIV